MWIYYGVMNDKIDLSLIVYSTLDNQRYKNDMHVMVSHTRTNSTRHWVYLDTQTHKHVGVCIKYVLCMQITSY